MIGDFLEGFAIFRENGLLDEQQLVGFQLLGENLGHRPVDAAVEVDADADIGADRLADSGDGFNSLFHLVVGVDDLHLLAAVEFDRLEAAGDDLLGIVGDVGGAVAADPGIDLDLVAHLAAEQRMDRLSQRLALDVPQRLVDAGNRAHVDGAAAIEAGAVHDVPVVLDQEGILADQIVFQLMHGRLHGQCPAFHHRLAPADNALVGLDFQEHPARRHNIRRQFRDLHGYASISALDDISGLQPRISGFLVSFSGHRPAVVRRRDRGRRDRACDGRNFGRRRRFAGAAPPPVRHGP